MNENYRYQWKEMPSNYHASYFNYIDLDAGRNFVVIDTLTGKEYIIPEKENKEVLIIPHDLYNSQEFWYWAYSTSSDLGLYVTEEELTPKLLEILVLATKDGEIFEKIPQHLLTQELYQKAVDKNPILYRKIPDQYKTPEMTLKYAEFPGASVFAIPDELLTVEIFRKIYNNKKGTDKIWCIRGKADRNPEFITKEMAEELIEISPGRAIRYIPQDFISYDYSKKAVEIDGVNLYYVPEQYRTREVSLIAFEKDPGDSIAYIPVQFQTVEMRKKAIDENPWCIRELPEEVITDELIYYALSKDGEVLYSVPIKKITPEMCLYAVNKSAEALHCVPKKYMTYDMCLNAVISMPSLIKNVPVKFLNSQFIADLQSANIQIPGYAISYVKKCLSAHRKLEQENLSVKLNGGETSEEIHGEFTKISIYDIPGFFSTDAIKVLRELEIYNVGDLFSKSSQPDFIINLGTKKVASEILSSIKLLKCKYLGEDPLIDETDELDIKEICSKFGFSTRITNSLVRAGFNYDGSKLKFFEVMRKPEIREEILRKAVKMGASSIDELVIKTQIVLDYHDKQAMKQFEIISESTEQSHDTTKKEIDSLESLKDELVRLRLEIAKLSIRTDKVLEKIQRKMLEQSKGGVVK